MEEKNVNSSNIKSIFYDEDTQELTVEFRSGGKYRYDGVSSVLNLSFMAATTSFGKFFHENIKDKFPTTKL